MLIDTVKAVKELGNRRYGNKVSMFLECDDNNVYLIKHFDNKKTLVNELIGGLLSLKVGLPSPILAFIELNKEFLNTTSTLRDADVIPGIHLGVQRIDNICHFNQIEWEKIVPHLQNIDDIHGVTCFDNWVLNDDRNNWGNNLIEIVDDSKYHYRVIDFSHCFNGNDWTTEEFKAKKSFHLMVPIFYPFRSFLKNRELYNPWLDRIEKFDEEIINEIINLIPESWKLTKCDKENLSEVLVDRKKILRKIVENDKIRIF